MRIQLETGEIRSWEESDAPALARHANDRRVSMQMRDAFPFPYGLADAHAFVAMARGLDPERFFALAVDSEAVGGIGLTLHKDVERLSAEVGYWLGHACWGRGIVTAALRAITQHAVREFGLVRVYALPLARNVASCRVLEKAGYVLEGRLRASAIKDGEILDQLLYAFVVQR